MSRNAIIVHGKPSREKYEASPVAPSDSHWLPWAKHQMSLAGVRTHTPDMPRPFAPDYREWEKEFDRYKPWLPNTTLVGLSAGASFLLRYAGEYDRLTHDKIILVAPWLDLKGKYGDFSDFEIDPKLPERCLGGMAVFYSSFDDEQAQASLSVVRSALPDIKYIDIPEYGHFMTGNTMTSHEFPELLSEVL